MPSPGTLTSPSLAPLHALSGPVQLSSQISTRSDYALSGPVAMQSFTRGYNWALRADWLQFTGSRRCPGTTMELAFQNGVTIPGLNIQTVQAHYRWGSLQSHVDQSGNSRNAIPVSDGGKVAAIVEDGVRLAGAPAVAAGLMPGTQTEAFSPAVEDPALQSYTISFWVNWQQTTGTIFGTRLDNADTGYYLIWQLNADDNKLWCYLHQTWSPAFYARVSMAMAGQPTGWHHVLWHVFWYTAAGGKRMVVRGFLDGQFMAEDTNALGGAIFTEAGKAYSFHWAPEFAGYVPRLLVQNQVTHDVGGLTESLQSGQVFSETIDEWVAARCFPVLDGTSQPVLEHSWLPGQQIFTPTRYPSVSQRGLNAPEFLITGPKQNSGVLSGHIAKVLVDFDTPGTASGQTVSVSVRAAAVLGGLDLASWSAWQAISASGLELPVAGGGQGAWVQIRLRLTSSNDALCLYSPQIRRVLFKVEPQLTTEAAATWDAEIFVEGYLDVGAEMLVTQPGSLDAEAELQVIYPAEFSVESEIEVQAAFFAEAEIFVAAHAYLEVEAEIEVPSPFNPASVDVTVEIEVINNAVDFGAEVFVFASVDFAADVEVVPLAFDAEIVVTQPASLSIVAEIMVVPELPGSCAPVTCNVPGAIWSPQALRTFTWGTASYQNYPVVDYLYQVSRTAGEMPNDSWLSAGATARQVTLDLGAWGSGLWYFLVAAKNSAGQYGSAAAAEVRFNVPPGIPGVDSMRINGGDCLGSRPLVARRPGSPHSLTWSPSFDEDPAVSVMYTAQIAHRADFGTDSTTGASSIIRLAQFVAGASLILDPSLESGIYFWRIQAWDGKQSSAWSPVGSFEVNQPPNAPSGLAVNQVV